MLADSKLLTFINEDNLFTLHFFEGQKLIHDLVMINSLKEKGFNFLRDSTLTAVHLISFLKPQENLGLYIDNKEPYFLFKMEMNSAGHVRTLLMPENFNQFPDKLSGQGRLSKIFPNQREPYTSIIPLENHDFHEVVDDILKNSYQTNTKMIISEKSDQSVLIMKLPKKRIEKVDEVLPDKSLEEFEKEITPFIEEIFNKGINNEEEIKKIFSNDKLTWLKGTKIEFQCSCSRERMVAGILSLSSSMSMDELFEGKKELETRCDYCKTYYLITRDEVDSKPKKTH